MMLGFTVNTVMGMDSSIRGEVRICTATLFEHELST